MKKQRIDGKMEIYQPATRDQVLSNLKQFIILGYRSPLSLVPPNNIRRFDGCIHSTIVLQLLDVISNRQLFRKKELIKKRKKEEQVEQSSDNRCVLACTCTHY